MTDIQRKQRQEEEKYLKQAGIMDGSHKKKRGRPRKVDGGEPDKKRGRPEKPDNGTAEQPKRRKSRASSLAMPKPLNTISLPDGGSLVVFYVPAQGV